MFVTARTAHTDAIQLGGRAISTQAFSRGSSLTLHVPFLMRFGLSPRYTFHPASLVVVVKVVATIPPAIFSRPLALRTKALRNLLVCSFLPRPMLSDEVHVRRLVAPGARSVRQP